MTLSLITWLFPSTARLGWLTTRIVNPSVEKSHGVAYLFRGIGAFLSPGFGAICSKLRQAGMWAEDLRCIGDKWACSHLVEQRKQGQFPGPVVLVGHSRGARRALVAAAQLEPLGITVDLLICVDVAFAPLVPANVRRVVHLYRSRWRIYPARPLLPCPGSPGQIENIDLDQPESVISGYGLNHLNITGSPLVQEWIVKEIEQLTKSNKSEAI